MTFKAVLSLCVFVVCLGVGGWVGVAAMLHLCELKELIPGVREKMAGAILGALGLVLFIWVVETILRKLLTKETTGKTG